MMMWMHKSETTGNCLIGTCLFVSGRELELELHLHAKELVQDRVTPVHHQWSLWCDGNQNTIKLVDNDELKAYRRLEESACIDRLELDIFAIPDELLGQQPHIVRMLYDLVDYYNNMMRIRRKYLVKKLDGCWSNKEMEQMLKTHDKYLERVDEKLDAIADAEGNCPPRPKVFDALPKLHK
ncbi:hypothetical protein D1007_46800 [Hordeum vulgare]|nr:hypothetical protein D1007_46800 [Hordeum vulgare]